MNAYETESAILSRLDQLAIPYRLLRHPPVYTMEDVNRLQLDAGTRSVKNLFLRDASQKHFYLVSMDAAKKLDTKALRTLLHSSALRFASEEQLLQKLGVEHGAVSPLAVLSDASGEVTLILDADFAKEELLCFHPGVNTASVFLTLHGLLQYLEALPNALLRLPL